jgi:hypothetical protein
MKEKKRLHKARHRSVLSLQRTAESLVGMKGKEGFGSLLLWLSVHHTCAPFSCAQCDSEPDSSAACLEGYPLHLSHCRVSPLSDPSLHAARVLQYSCP